ncbi:MAG: hypothetical protein K0R19_1919 [Bacillota bacterium]|nr:hypothetical protein [Bacillota bacterium]
MQIGKFNHVTKNRFFPGQIKNEILRCPLIPVFISIRKQLRP